MLNTCMVVCLGGTIAYCCGRNIRCYPCYRSSASLLSSTQHIIKKNKNKTNQLRIQELETFPGLPV